MKKEISKIKENKPNYFKKIFGNFVPVLSKMGKSFLLPIALLPIAGILMGIGKTIANEAIDGGFWDLFGKTMGGIGDVAFANLPILFAVAIAISFTSDSGVAALTAIIGFLVFNIIQSTLLIPNIDESGKDLGTFHLLFYDKIEKKQLTANLGINSFNTGVFGAICVGGVSAACYKKFYKVQLPNWIGFFSGTRLVPIITIFAVIPLSMLFILVWAPIGQGLSWIGNKSAELPVGIDSLMHQVVSRSLIPFGLHHVFNNVLWQTAAGGDLYAALENAPIGWESYSGKTAQDIMTYIDLGKSGATMGDQAILTWVLSNQDWVNFTDLDNLGMNIGRFLSGKYTFMLLGLPMASMAMWLALPKENRKKVMGIYISSAMCCFLTGITEPIEYTFLFVAPWLFYGVHMPLAAIASMATGALHIHAGSMVSAGFIDFIVYALIPWDLGTKAYHILWLAPIFGVLYFATFYFLTRWKRIDIPGMNSVENQKMFTKDDVVSKKDNSNTNDKKKKSKNSDLMIEKCTNIIKFLGGPENITNVDSCASRLRVNVLDQDKVDSDGIMSLGGCKGVMKKNNYIQAVYGGEQEVLKPYIKEILEEMAKTQEK